MVSRPEDNVAHLGCSAGLSDDELAQLLRLIKNSVIGNRMKKVAYLQLGIWQPLLVVLKTRTAPHVQSQALATIGSLVNGIPSAVPQLLSQQEPCLPLLLNALGSASKEVVVAAARALKLICKSPLAPRRNLYLDSNADRIIALLGKAKGDTLNEIGARLIAYSCTTKDVQMLLIEKNAHSLLIQILFSTFPKGQDAALEALAALTLCNRGVSETICRQQNIFGQICRMSKSDRITTKLGAMRLLVHMYRSGGLPSSCMDVVLALLPQLSKLLSQSTDSYRRLLTSLRSGRLPTTASPPSKSSIAVQTGMGEDSAIELAARVPYLLYYFASESEAVQKLGADADTIPRLVEMLKLTADVYLEREKEREKDASNAGTSWSAVSSVHDTFHALYYSPYSSLLEPEARVIEAGLLAIASLCGAREEARKQAIDGKILDVIVATLNLGSPSLRIAACMCTRSLSRSVKQLRCALIRAGVAKPLFTILKEPVPPVKDGVVPLLRYHDVILGVTSTLCNLVMDFSELKRDFILEKGVEIVSKLLQPTEGAAQWEDVCSADELRVLEEKHYHIRLNATWVLKNLAYFAPPEIKAEITRHLPVPVIIRLLKDPWVRKESRRHSMENFVPPDMNIVNVTGISTGSDSSSLEVQAMTLLRNIAYGRCIDVSWFIAQCSIDGPSDNDKEMTDAGVADSGKSLEGLYALLDVVEDLIGSYKNSVDSPSAALCVQAIYLVCNICAGFPLHKTLISRRKSLLENLKRILSLRNVPYPTLQENPAAGSPAVAICWCVINILWSDSSDGDNDDENVFDIPVLSVAERLSAIEASGLVEEIRQCSTASPDSELRDRSTSVLTRIDEIHGQSSSDDFGARGGSSSAMQRPPSARRDPLASLVQVEEFAGWPLSTQRRQAPTYVPTSPAYIPSSRAYSQQHEEDDSSEDLVDEEIDDVGGGEGEEDEDSDDEGAGYGVGPSAMSFLT